MGLRIFSAPPRPPPQGGGHMPFASGYVFLGVPPLQWGIWDLVFGIYSAPPSPPLKGGGHMLHASGHAFLGVLPLQFGIWDLVFGIWNLFRHNLEFIQTPPPIPPPSRGGCHMPYTSGHRFWACPCCNGDGGVPPIASLWTLPIFKQKELSTFFFP